MCHTRDGACALTHWAVKAEIAELTRVKPAISALTPRCIVLAASLDDVLLIPVDMSPMLSSACLAGASEAAIAETTGHTSLDMVRRYTRKADRFRRGVSGKVGL